MLFLALLILIWHRLLRPLQRKRQPYHVVDVRQETDDVWTVSLAPPPGEVIPAHAPGQFHFITFFRGRGLPEEEHHWTIASSPMDKYHIRSTIKALGDFTSTIKDTRIGDTAAVQGPFGRFSYVFHPGEKDLVFLAGGIGITPLMSMLRHMRDLRDDRFVTLIYANSEASQIVFRHELAEIEQGGAPRLQVVHVLSHPDEHWTGETGHIDQETIRKYCGDHFKGKTFYVCGPPGMVKRILDVLASLGVLHQQIRLEIFSFLD
jgi:ferredoxin-NADP reductase